MPILGFHHTQRLTYMYTFPGVYAKSKKEKRDVNMA